MKLGRDFSLRFETGVFLGREIELWRVDAESDKAISHEFEFIVFQSIVERRYEIL